MFQFMEKLNPLTLITTKIEHLLVQIVTIIFRTFIAHNMYIINLLINLRKVIGNNQELKKEIH